MRADASENREAIIRAAWDLYSTQGMDVSRRAIAKKAGVGVATLQRHFPGQSDLALGIMLYGKQLVQDIYTSHEDAWGTESSAKEAWEGIIRAVIDLGIGSFATQLLPHLLVNNERPAEVRKNLQDLLETVEVFMERGRKWGLVKEELTPMEFHLAVASVSRPLPDHIMAEAPNFKNTMTRIVIDGLRP